MLCNHGHLFLLCGCLYCCWTTSTQVVLHMDAIFFSFQVCVLDLYRYDSVDFLSVGIHRIGSRIAVVVLPKDHLQEFFLDSCEIGWCLLNRRSLYKKCFPFTSKQQWLTSNMCRMFQCWLMDLFSSNTCVLKEGAMQVLLDRCLSLFTQDLLSICVYS